MKHYKAILFDADETILDFKASEKHAFYKTVAHWGLDNPKELLEIYTVANQESWHLYEQGRLTEDRLTVYRFELFFERSGLSFDAVEWNTYYRECLAETGYLLPYAVKILDYAVQHFDLYIVTNGLAKTQRRRLKNAGIDHYFSNVFISEEIGSQKPDVGYFKSVFKQISYTPDEVLLVGDSLTSDIAGGIAYGIDTCFLNRKNIQTNLSPAFVVRNLEELKDLLQKCW